MKDNFVKFNFETAIESKKEILNNQMHLIYAREHLKNFLRLKKQELIIKNKIRENLNLIKKKMNSITSHFPKRSRHEIELKPIISKKRSNIEDELLKIKRDLEILEKKI